MAVSFSRQCQLAHENRLAAFREYAAIRKSEVSVSCGSGRDCDVVKILQI